MHRQREGIAHVTLVKCHHLHALQVREAVSVNRIRSHWGAQRARSSRKIQHAPRDCRADVGVLTGTRTLLECDTAIALHSELKHLQTSLATVSAELSRCKQKMDRYLNPKP